METCFQPYYLPSLYWDLKTGLCAISFVCLQDIAHAHELTDYHENSPVSVPN